MVRAAVAVLAGAVMLVAPQTAVAQSSQWDSQVEEQLASTGQLFSAHGFEPTHDTYTGTLRTSEFEYLTVTLHAGTRYALVGMCDTDCRELDLELYNADGREVEADREPNDAPLVAASPDVTQQYRLKVIMSTCSASPCYYGIGVYSR